MATRLVASPLPALGLLCQLSILHFQIKLSDFHFSKKENIYKTPLPLPCQSCWLVLNFHFLPTLYVEMYFCRHFLWVIRSPYRQQGLHRLHHHLGMAGEGKKRNCAGTGAATGGGHLERQPTLVL